MVTSLTHEEADQLCKILGITKGDKICSKAEQKKDEPENVKDLKEFSKEFTKAAAEASNVPTDMLPTPDEVKDKREEVMEIIKKYFCTPADPANAKNLPDEFGHAAWVKAKIVIEMLENYDAFSKVMEILWKVFKEYPSLGK